MKRPQPKLRRDAVLKKLEGPARAQIAEWLEADGWESCAQRIFSELGIASPKDASKPVSRPMIYEALAYWRMEEKSEAAFAEADAQEELMKQFRPEDPHMARQFGEFVLLQAANRTGDKDLFTVATMAQDSRRRLDLEEKSGAFKAEAKKIQLAQKDRDFQLAREKFVTESCEKIMQAARDPKMREIAEDTTISNAQKIALIRQAYFADIDALQASGKVVLPE